MISGGFEIVASRLFGMKEWAVYLVVARIALEGRGRCLQGSVPPPFQHKQPEWGVNIPWVTERRGRELTLKSCIPDMLQASSKSELGL